MNDFARKVPYYYVDEAGRSGEFLDPDAVAYVALGSQLGLTVLRRDLPPEDRTGIFGSEPDVAAWKAFAARIADLSSETPAARRTISDARRAFAAFRAAALNYLNFQTHKT